MNSKHGMSVHGLQCDEGDVRHFSVTCKLSDCPLADAHLFQPLMYHASCNAQIPLELWIYLPSGTTVSCPSLSILANSAMRLPKFLIWGCVLQQDEIKMFLDARYVSSSEACWRLFKYSMHERTPAVVRLAVHLEGEHVGSMALLKYPLF